MQPRNRHQMTRARGAHQQPVGGADFVLRADRQRDDDAAMRRVGEHRVDPRTQRGAPAVHRHADAARIRAQPHAREPAALT